MVYIQNGTLFSHKNNEIRPFTPIWLDLEVIIVREVSQKEKDKHHVITYIWNLKHDTNDFIYKTEKRLIDTEWFCGFVVTKGERGQGRDKLRFYCIAQGTVFINL